MKAHNSKTDLNRHLEAYAAVAKLPERNLRRRLGIWPIYAAATGAALAGASAASADIIYSGFKGLSGSSVSFSPDGIHDFRFSARTQIFRHFVSSTTFNGMRNPSFNLKSEFFYVGAGAGAAVFESPGVKNFAYGARISGTGPGGGGILGYVRSIGTRGGKILRTFPGNPPFGNFPGGGYVGFELNGKTAKGNSTPPEFGWIFVTFSDSPLPGSFDIVDWAYNTDGPIDAGQTSSPVPEPATMPVMLLAAGAAGITVWKRRRAQANNT